MTRNDHKSALAAEGGHWLASTMPVGSAGSPELHSHRLPPPGKATSTPGFFPGRQVTSGVLLYKWHEVNLHDRLDAVRGLALAVRPIIRWRKGAVRNMSPHFLACAHALRAGGRLSITATRALRAA